MPRDDEIPLGWRLATIEEVKGYEYWTRVALDAIKKAPTQTYIEYFCIDDDYQVFERRFFYGSSFLVDVCF